MKNVILVVALVMGSIGAHAAEGSAQENPCNDQEAMQTQVGITECAAYEYAQSKKALDDVYGRLLNEISGSKRGVSKLKAAQRSWEKYRTAQCKYESFGSEGGSIHPVEMMGCETALTNQRKDQLKALLSP